MSELLEAEAHTPTKLAEAPAVVDGGPVEDQLFDPSDSRWRRFIGSNFGLIAAPIAMAILGFWLFWRVSNTDKIFQEERALRWETNMWPQIVDTISLTWKSTVLVLLVAIPLGILLTRPGWKRVGGPVLAMATSGQATPVYGLLVVFAAWLGTGQGTSVSALALFAILPVLRNTIVGLNQVDPAVVEAAKGMGLTRMQLLRRIELPLAVPIILAGIRTALVINVSMSTLAFLIGGGGLGITINTGIKLQRDLLTFTGAAMVAILALFIDWAGAVAEKVLRPKGL